MSYCHICNGNIGNLAYTFGGRYNGFGSRGDPNSYTNYPLGGTVLFEPRRVNAKMWAHMSSRGTCTQFQPPPPTPTPTIIIQAESYSSMFGVVRENTSDVGGGQNVGNIQTGNWMSYPPVTIPTTGTYWVLYRVATPFSGGSLQLERWGGPPVRLSIPATGGYQIWRTVSHTVNLLAGSQFFNIKATGCCWNINWFSITKA
jgi:hypothetical protein